MKIFCDMHLLSAIWQLWPNDFWVWLRCLLLLTDRWLWSVIFQDVNHEDFELSFRYQFLAPPVDNLPPELQGPYIHPLDDQVKGTVFDDSMDGKLALKDCFKLVKNCLRYEGGFIYVACKEIKNALGRQLQLLPQSPNTPNASLVFQPI
jgi:hypothetical protein